MSPTASNGPLRTRLSWIAAVLVIALAPAGGAEEPSSSETRPSSPPATAPIADPEAGGASKVGDQIVDAVVLRPLGALSLIGGAVFFVVTSPLVLVSQVIDYGTSWDVMVVAPWEYTVERPLGDL